MAGQKYFFEGIQDGKFYEGIIDPSTGQPAALTPVTAIPDGTQVIPTSVPQVNSAQQYYIDTIIYSTGQTIVAQCNAITFKNFGTSNVTVSGIPLANLDYIGISGNEGEIDITRYQIVFDNTGTNVLLVIRKCYIG